jgi:hypothetical protein
LLGGGAAAWPVTVRAHQPIPIVGFLNGASPSELGARVVAFRDGLAEKGYVEGHSVAIEYRWGLGQYERLPEMAVDLVRQPASVLCEPQKPRRPRSRSSLRWEPIPSRSGSLPA